jgi:LDH2 family malate/lactate/ureidoglycolate dehydrogenase
MEDFKRDMEDMIRRLRASPKAEGSERIYIHGEKEFAFEEKYRLEGVPIHRQVYENLKAIAAEVAVPFHID